MTAPLNRRPWYQFSLRTLILLLTIVSVPLGWLAYERNELRKREAAIAAIENLGGKVKFDTSQPFRESWLRPLLSDKPASEVVGVSLQRKSRMRATLPVDAGLVHFDGLTRLQWLDLDQAKFSDAELVQLARLTELNRLSLRETAVSDDGLVHLKGLEQLEHLWLGYTRVTDAGLVHLAGLRTLKTLDLGYTQVTDAGLVHLHSLTELKELRLHGSKVTDQGVSDLKQALPNLLVRR